jgi:hypothetical protein
VCIARGKSRVEISYIIDTEDQTKNDWYQTTMGWTQRQINTFLFILILTGALVALIDVLTRDEHPMTRIGYAVGALCAGGLLIAYQRGWEYARHALALAIMLAVAFFTNEPYVSQQMDLLHAVPMVVALVLTGPRWLLLNAILFLVIMLVRGGWSGIYTSIPNLVAYWVLAGGMILSRLAVDNAQRLEEARRIAEEERLRTAEALALAQQRADELAQRNAEQERLLQLVSDLETPAIAIADGVPSRAGGGQSRCSPCPGAEQTPARNGCASTDTPCHPRYCRGDARRYIGGAEPGSGRAGVAIDRVSGRYQRDYASSRHPHLHP